MVPLLGKNTVNTTHAFSLYVTHTCAHVKQLHLKKSIWRLTKQNKLVAMVSTVASGSISKSTTVRNLIGLQMKNSTSLPDEDFCRAD